MENTTLSPEHRRFLLVDQCFGAAVINFILNAGIAWLLVRALARVPLWGDPGIAGDTAATSFLLPFITCLIVTPLVRRRLAAGRIQPLPEAPRSAVLQRLVARSTLSRGALLGLASVVLAALPTVLWFAAIGPTELSHGSFLWFKASFAAILAAVVTPLIAWLALAPPSQPPASASS